MSASTQTTPSEAQSGGLLAVAVGFGIVGFYALFTLLPNSNSLMVKWPWVFLWQFGLMLCPIALIFQLWRGHARKLGGWLDWLAGAWCATLVLSATFAEFKHQAFWYGWAAICGIAALYTVSNWLTNHSRVRFLLTFHGGLTVIFSISSLAAWFFQTVRPYLSSLEELKSYGIERALDLSIIPLRNWHPIGHQNYVAGYLVLSIPLLVGLAFAHSGLKRIGWVVGALISLVTLHSTSSRGGWLGLVASVAVFIGLSIWQHPRFRKPLAGVGIASFGVVALWGLTSDRIRGLFTAFSTNGSGGELFYRVITNVTGWKMGLDRPLFGAGLGSVTLLYQKYRPEWAGREAELTYQLHSTPAQLWAELGLIGALLTLSSLVAIAYLSIRWCMNAAETETQGSELSLLMIGVISGLVGYAIYAITDYQLDNVCTGGTLVIFLSVLIFESRDSLEFGAIDTSNRFIVSQKVARRFALAGIGIVSAISLWLYPIHKAWMLSSQGFLALQQQDINSFVAYLERANKLAPWEPYYVYQLAWNLGELAYKSEDPQQQEALRQKSIQWFEKAIVLSPYREFGYSNLGWLQINSDPQAATHNFRKAIQLVPEKRGVFFALGYSLLQEGKFEESLQAMVTELIQQPILLASPIWQSPELSTFYHQVLKSYEAELNRRLAGSKTELSQSFLYQVLGTLHWWQGDFDKARIALEKAPSPLNDALLRLAKTQPGEKVEVKVSEQTTIGMVFAAWQNPQESSYYLTQAIAQPNETGAFPTADYISSQVVDLENSLESSSTFYEWVRYSPALVNRNYRLGFGTTSRHIDGSIPYDFSPRVESAMKSLLLDIFFPNPTFKY